MKKTIIKIISLILLLSLLVLSGIFIIYPNYQKIALKISDIDIERVAHNSTLNIFAEITKPSIEQLSSEQGMPDTIEFISKDMISAYQQEHGISTVEQENTKLKIKNAEIEGNVVDGLDASAMDRGFWYYPLSKQPGQKGNTVIIAHRFLYVPPRKDTFFNLDKIRIGDKIEVIQEGTEYTYTVIQTKIVERNDTSVLKDSRDYRITLITCTPLWTSQKRLVIIGKMDKIYGNI